MQFDVLIVAAVVTVALLAGISAVLVAKYRRAHAAEDREGPISIRRGATRGHQRRRHSAASPAEAQ